MNKTINGSNIPKLIIQTGKSKTELSHRQKKWISSWLATNPDYEYRFYDDQDCLDMIEMEFPQYMEAYLALPKPVEKADFFRYLAILRYGGFYADIDTTCKRPLDELVNSEDKIIIGIESIIFDPDKPNYSNIQYCQWTFGAEPNHPLLQDIVDQVAQNSLNHTVFSSSTHNNTLQKTGPMAFSRIVKNYINEPGVRILTQAHFGRLPFYFPPQTYPYDNPSFYSSNIFVIHHFEGSWMPIPFPQFNEVIKLILLLLFLFIIAFIWIKRKWKKNKEQQQQQRRSLGDVYI